MCKKMAGGSIISSIYWSSNPWILRIFNGAALV